MNTAQKVRLEREAHPERFCPRCLWRTGDGSLCPRHAEKPNTCQCGHSGGNHCDGTSETALGCNRCNCGGFVEAGNKFERSEKKRDRTLAWVSRAKSPADFARRNSLFLGQPGRIIPLCNQCKRRHDYGECLGIAAKVRKQR